MNTIELPGKWISLKEACALKGVSYRTIARTENRWRQPGCGKGDGVICGKKAWRPETIKAWIEKDDRQLVKDWTEIVIQEAEEKARRKYEQV